MGRGSRRTARYAVDREITQAREAIERRWRDRLAEEPGLAPMVAARGTPDEPFHRWIHYKQGFSPALVRRFLQERAERDATAVALPVLDPFAGSGTVPIECARRRVSAIGVEALASLAFLADARHERELPPFPAIGDVIEEETISDAGEWEAIAERLAHRLHRAALMLAVGRRHTSSGKINRGADPLPETLKSVLAMIREDLLPPLPISNVTHHGDARRLAMIGDESIGAILTSPPYLSRHDYTAIAAPFERVYRHWFPDDERDRSGTNQMAAARTRGLSRAAAGLSDSSEALSSGACDVALRRVCDERRGLPPRRGLIRRGSSPLTRRSDATAHSLPPSQGGTKGGSGAVTVPEAAREASEQLEATGEAELASVVRAYFVDLALVFAECHRVLAPGGVGWLVVGGARLKGVHIPSDIIVAEQMQAVGLCVDAVRVARKVTDSRRKFGRLGHIAPRESVIVMTKR